jgi:outer membrane lipoprotein SlyB
LNTIIQESNMNRNMRMVSMACAVALTSALTACAGWNADPSAEQQQGPGTAYSAPYGTYPAYPAQAAGYVEYGRVTNVALISQGSRPGNSAAGTVLGAVAGGLLGNQIGHGVGRGAATILGAAGGAAVGNHIAGGNNPYADTAGPVYRVSVQTDSGQLRTYDVSATGDLRPGDRVRIENGVIYLS